MTAMRSAASSFLLGFLAGVLLGALLSSSPDVLFVPAASEAPRPVLTTVQGTASWYDYVPGGAAAGPALRAALGPTWRGREVIVERRTRFSSDAGAGIGLGLSMAARVRLSDWCECYRGTPRERIVDLDRATFALFARPSRGLVEVELSWP